MRILSMCLCLLALVGCVSPPQGIIKINPHYLGPEEVTPLNVSASRMCYAFRGERGIYSFDVIPIPQSVKTVTFVLQEQIMLSSLSIQPSGGQWTSLYEPNVLGTADVQVVRKGSDWHATFTGPALDKLRLGGRFQVIDVYRE